MADPPIPASALPPNVDLLRAIVAWHEAAGFMHHALEAALAPVERFVPDQATPQSLDAARRVIAAYRRARAESVSAGLSLWKAIEYRHAAFLRAMDVGDVATVQARLGAMLTDELTWGMARLTDVEAVLQRRCTDALRSLAEACGATQVISAEHLGGGSLRAALKVDLDKLGAATERMLGLDLSCARVCANYGVRIGRHVMNTDSLLHSYTVWRLAQHRATADSAIIEIGGGYGCLGELFARAGMTRFTIYDLPWVNAMQGYYLIMARPDTTVRLYGEDRGDLAVMPFWKIHDLADRSVDYVINVNSMPELNVKIVRRYLKTIARVLRRTFLSINQESMVPSIGGPLQWVHDAVRADGHLTCTGRYRWWMEQGYVEETYEARTRG